MPLTPEDVSSKRFTPVRLREGYDMGEVDQFLDEVEAELSRLTQENADLRSKVSTQSGAQSDAPVPHQQPADLAKSAPGSGAQRTAEPVAAAGESSGETIPVQTIPQASNAAARLLEIATRNADELVDEAKDEADRIVGEARTKSERLDSESKDRADRLEADARRRAELLDSETADRRRQVFGELEEERDKLNLEVENLRSFEREYRARLKSYFTQQLEALETPQDSSPSDSAQGEPAPQRLRSILGEDDA